MIQAFNKFAADALRSTRRAFCVLLAISLTACEEDNEAPVATHPAPPPVGDASWDAEVFQSAARQRLADILGSPSIEDDAPSAMVKGSLRPPDSAAISSSQVGDVLVTRWKGKSTRTDTTSLASQFAQLTKAWPEGERRIKVKHFNVQLDPDRLHVTTGTDFTAVVKGENTTLQQTAKWNCRWRNAEPPELLEVTLIKLEEVRRKHDGVPALRDVTVPLLGHLPAYRDSLQFGANHWITRLPRLKHRFQHGVAVGDINGDGIEDIYLCQPEGLPNTLLVRDAQGQVRDAAAEFGLDFRDITTSALFADFDNDGDQDLAIAFRSPIDIFENVGGKFERRFGLPDIGQIFNLAAADVDSDGRLDLYICRYQNLDEQGRAPSAIPLHDAQNGGKNSLLKNLGDWKFEDVTTELGLDHNNNRWTVAAAWEDFDRDGDLDLYCANDYGRNNLYRCDRSDNGQILFTDIAPETGVEDMTTSMGVTWADPNRDGVPDIYVSNMYSSAGRRVTFQKNFKRNIPGSDETHVKAWQNAAMGNSLFQGAPDGSFNHVSAKAGVQKGLWSWGTVFADMNHDGWDDLLVANGFITGPGDAPDL